MAGSGEYDEALLKDAPKLEKADIQNGYSTRLLQLEISPSFPAASNSTNAPQRMNAGETADWHAVEAPGGVEAQSPPPKPRPFYRTRRGGIIIGALFIAIIVAAVVGGVVGSKKNADNSPLPVENSATVTNVVPTATSSGDGSDKTSILDSSPPPVTTAPSTTDNEGQGALPSGIGNTMQEAGNAANTADQPNDSASTPSAENSLPETQNNGGEAEFSLDTNMDSLENALPFPKE